MHVFIREELEEKTQGAGVDLLKALVLSSTGEIELLKALVLSSIGEIELLTHFCHNNY